MPQYGLAAVLSGHNQTMSQSTRVTLTEDDLRLIRAALQDYYPDYDDAEMESQINKVYDKIEKAIWRV